MLVLSRRVTEQIVFPTLGITLSVVRILGNVVRLGVEAPPDVPVMRGELAESAAPESGSSLKPQLANQIDEHLLRNCLNTATLALRVAEKQLRACPDESEMMIGKALRELEEVRLSLAQVRSARQGPDGRAHAAGPLEAVPWRALLVEDNDNERQLLAAYLRMRGFDVVEMSDSEAAIGYLEQHEVPDVMLLDMNMPQCSAVQAVDWIRQRERLSSLWIFGVSAKRSGPSRNGPKCAGVDHWIQKPIDPEVVVEQISRVIRCRTAERPA